MKEENKIAESTRRILFQLTPAQLILRGQPLNILVKNLARAGVAAVGAGDEEEEAPWKL